MNGIDTRGTRMKALLLHGVGDLQVQTVPKPSPAPDEVLVRVALCGVCGSDIPRIFEKGTYSFPLICGHEFAGTVEACGDGASRFASGDVVTAFPLLWCGKCPACTEGQYAQCSDYDYLGSRRDGAFAEYVVAPERNLLPVPEGVSLEEAAMTEPAAVALHALRRAGGSLVGQTVAVFGTGTIGLIAAQWARNRGAARVFLFDVVPERLDLARSLGFKHLFDSRTRDPVEVVAYNTNGQGAHLCIEAAGVPDTLLEALEATRRSGHMVLLGNLSANVTLPPRIISHAMRREISVHGTWNSTFSTTRDDDDWHQTFAAVAARKLRLLPLITHTVSLDESVGVLEMMRDRTQFFGKVLIASRNDALPSAGTENE